MREQPTERLREQPTDRLTTEELIQALQTLHGLRIFYMAEWLEERTYPPSSTELQPDEVLNTLARDHHLEILHLDAVAVLLPAAGQASSTTIGPDGGELVGDPANRGRFLRATVSGVILDGSNGEPLPGSVVYEMGSGRGTAAGPDGYFRLELPVGEHRLRFSHVGYDDLFRDILLISDGEISPELFSGTSHLEAVTITARHARENILRTQMSRIELGALEISELPQTFGERDVLHSVTLLPGVQTVGEFGTGFNVRGGSADQNLVLLEHAPLFNASHLFGLMSVVNPDMVSDVTLMKAGIPAKYGERASSIMDIRLGGGGRPEKTTVMGGIGILSSRMLLQTPLPFASGALSFGARSSYSDWYLRRSSEQDLMNSNAGFYDLTATSRFQPGPRSTLTLFGYYSADRFGFSTDSKHGYASTLASASWNSRISELLSASLLVALSNYNYSVTETPENFPATWYSFSSGISYQSAKGRVRLTPSERHIIEAGADLIMYKVSPGTRNPQGEASLFVPETVMQEQARELAFHIGDEVHIGSSLSVDAGLRYTLYRLMEPGEVLYGGLEPRAGIRLELNEASSVKASYNRIRQYINLVSNTSIMAPSDLWKLSDPYLEPLKSDQYVAGYFRNFSDNTLETSLEVYYKQIYNTLEYTSGASLVMNPAVQADLVNAMGYNYGIELWVRQNSGRLTGWGSYTWSRSMRRTDSPDAARQINGNAWFPSNFDRPHNLALNMNYYISQRWRFGATFSYSTGRPVTLPESAFVFGNNILIYLSDRNKYRLPDYHRLDISITMGENHRANRRGKGHWTLTIMNLYGRKNPYSVYFQRESNVLRQARSFNLYQLYILGSPTPTLTYNFSF